MAAKLNPLAVSRSLPTLRQMIMASEVEGKENILRMMFEAGCFRQGLDDKARYIAGPNGNVAAAGQSAVAVTPDTDILALRAFLSSAISADGNAADYGQAVGLSAINRQGKANQIISAAALATARLNGSLLDPNNRTLGLPLGQMLITPTLPLLMTIENDGGETAVTSVGAMGFEVHPARLADFRLNTTRWLCGDRTAIAAAANGTINLFGVQDFLAEAMIIDAASDLSVVGGLVNPESISSHFIAQVLLKGFEFLSVGVATDTVPADTADWNRGGFIFRKGGKRVRIPASAASQMQVIIRNGGAGGSTVAVTLAGQMIDPEC